MDRPMTSVGLTVSRRPFSTVGRQGDQEGEDDGDGEQETEEAFSLQGVDLGLYLRTVVENGLYPDVRWELVLNRGEAVEDAVGHVHGVGVRLLEDADAQAGGCRLSARY